MQIVLSDYNCEGQTRAIFRALDAGGYLKLVPLELRLFVDVGLPADAKIAQFGGTVRTTASSSLPAIARRAMENDHWRVQSDA